MNPSEARTRKQLIDPALTRAGWNLHNPAQVGAEIPVDDPRPEAAHPDLLGAARDAPPDYALYSGITDYCLYQPNGEVIAIVEAKRSSRDARIAETQAEYYVTEIEKRQSFRPFAFLTNGHSIYFWDVGQSPKRLVAGFFSPDDLARLLYIRQHKTPLASAPIQTAITNRGYQQEAIRRVCEAFDRGKRKALLVMATGTGKTRTVMSLIDLFLRTNQARRVLFVADRDALVTQAQRDGFKAWLPDEPRDRITSQNIDLTKRLYVATLQTISNCFDRISPAFFDLVIFDEVHRSIFNKYDEALGYFDGRMIGLTATPAEFVERNTFTAFDCADGKPTFLYTYEDAQKDKVLVPFSLYKAQTHFQRKGIHGVDLSEEEQNLLVEQGIDPDALDFSGTQLEREVSNKDTLRKQWEEFWENCIKDESGQLPGKTIVFALTQDHAMRLAEVFAEMYPQYPDLVRVITSESDYKGMGIEKFKREDRLRIALSVDMLDTGVDVPEVVNLVFMKPVQSQIKLWQMIGRGTRSHETCKVYAWLPNGHKDEFLIIDYWDNDFAKRADDRLTQALPVLVTIFNTRLKLLETDLSDQESPACQQVIADLRAQVGQIPTDAFSVKKVYPDIQPAWDDAFWRYFTPAKIDFLRLKVGPLLRFASGIDVEAATFTSKVERLKLQLRTGADPAATAASIVEDVTRMPNFVYQDPALLPSVQLGSSPARLAQASAEDLTRLIVALAEQMKNRKTKPNAFLLLDLKDAIDLRGYILLHAGAERVYVKEYRERVERRIRELAEHHPTIQAIQRDEPVTDQQLVELEKTLERELGGGDVELTEANIRKAYGVKVTGLIDFLREILDLTGLSAYQEIIRRLFDDYIGKHTYNADQIRFLRAVQSVFLRKHRVTMENLYEGAFATFGANAVERLFTPGDIQEMLAFTQAMQP
ncbi:MAG: DEAD/DEAH box helicase family protein [Anaerolineae bacterium]